MATFSISTRRGSKGVRYVVRYRLGGRAYPLTHGGSFRTLKEAKARRDLIAGLVAVGQNPAAALDQMREQPAPAKTFAAWADEYQASRIDVAEVTAKNLDAHLNTIRPAFGEQDPQTITPTQVQEWITGLALKPSTVRRYLATLRMVLDYAGADPNPARDRKVRLPRQEREQIAPPSARDVELIILHAPARWRLMLTMLAETGMRISELLAVEWADLDRAGERLIVRKGKTAAARRWVPVSSDLLEELTRSTPADDQTGRIFAGTVGAVQGVMKRACQSAGIAHYSPHDFRHRWASLQVKRGVPITEIAAHLGHSRQAVTLDVYSHVLLDD
jgi:integrase